MTPLHPDEIELAKANARAGGSWKDFMTLGRLLCRKPVPTLKDAHLLAYAKSVTK